MTTLTWRNISPGVDTQRAQNIEQMLLQCWSRICAPLSSVAEDLGESDVYRRQNLTTKVDPCAVKVKIFLLIVDLLHRHSNESERANYDIYDDFTLKKPFGLHGLNKTNSAR